MKPPSQFIMHYAFPYKTSGARELTNSPRWRGIVLSTILARKFRSYSISCKGRCPNPVFAPYKTSGAREIIFMKSLSRSSRATGPKIRVPRGVLSSLMTPIRTRSTKRSMAYLSRQQRRSFTTSTLSCLTIRITPSRKNASSLLDRSSRKKFAL